MDSNKHYIKTNNNINYLYNLVVIGTWGFLEQFFKLLSRGHKL